MELHKLSVCLLLAAALRFSCGVINPESSSIELTAPCLWAGSADGQSSSRCNDIWNVGLVSEFGRLPNGTCVRCGTESPSPDPSKCTAVTYRDRQQRYCACSVGFYGGQIASSCQACPAGSTTQGFGAKRVSECNVCATGYRGTAPNKCEACSSTYPGPVTTRGPGNNRDCVCPQGYTGKPGDCKKCPGVSTTARPGAQKCVCPAGGKAPWCRPCNGGGEVVDGKCVCIKGTTGQWPNCKYCPATNSLAYSMTTPAPGSQQCVCDALDWRQVVVGSKGACSCDEKNGYYLKVVPSWAWDTDRSPRGPCEKIHPDSPVPGAKIIKVDGRKRLGCDVSKGYGAALTEQLFNPGSPLCIKCRDYPDTVLDKKTSRCVCKPGYHINSAFASPSHMNESERFAPPGTRSPFPRGQPTKQQYCIRCRADHLKVSSVPSILQALFEQGLLTPLLAPTRLPFLDNTFCRCNWEAGWAGNLQSNGLCGKCPSSTPTAGPTGCRCGKGQRWVPDPANSDRRFCGDLKQYPCPQGFKVGKLGDCECFPGVYIDDTLCLPKSKVPEYYAKLPSLTISYWANVVAPALPLPASIRSRPKTAVVQASIRAVNSTSNLLGLAEGLQSRKDVAVVVEGELCLGRAYFAHVAEVKAVGLALLLEVGGAPNAPPPLIKLDGAGSKVQAGYAEDSNCRQVELHFSSSREDGRLGLKLVPFEIPVPLR